VVVLSHGIWRRRFGADPSIVGQDIRLNGVPYTVTGVAPPEFKGLYKLFAVDMWVPMRWTGENRQSDMNNRGGRWMLALGRLTPGATFAQAQSEAQTIGKRMQDEYPENEP
jgi:putative ABC transport system permease protein